MSDEQPKGSILESWAMSKGWPSVDELIAERDQLRAALAAATQRAEEAEADRATLMQQRDQWKNDAYAAAQRAETAEAKLALVDEYATYYSGAWDAFDEYTDAPEPLDFDEWLAQSEVQP